MENAIKTETIITDIKTSRNSDGDITHDVYVEFEVNGKKYNGELGLYTSGMYEGGTATVYYNPDNPNKFRSSADSFGGIMMASMGCIFFAIGIIPVCIGITKTNNNKKLLETSEKIYAEFDQVIVNQNYSVNGVHPYKIVCQSEQYQDIEFMSENIWKNPEELIEERGIKNFAVYINPEKPNKYYISLEEIREYL